MLDQVLPSMSASPTDIESSLESALSQESPHFEPMLQPVAAGELGDEVCGFGPVCGDCYVIDCDFRNAAQALQTFGRKNRSRRCPVCLLGVGQRGFMKHVKKCIAGFNAGTAVTSPMGADSRGVLADVLASSGEPILFDDMLNMMKLLDATYAKFGHHVSLHPRHRGKILGFGRNPETGMNFISGSFGPPGTFDRLVDKVEDFARDVLRSPIVRVCEQWIRALSLLRAASSQDVNLPMPCFSGSGASTLYCMWNYSAVDWMDPAHRDHPPPWTIAMRKAPEMPCCAELGCCTICSTTCSLCPHCVRNFSPRDRSLTIMLVKSTTKARRSQPYFTCGWESWPIDDTGIFIYDGKKMAHGLWAPFAGKPWYAVCFVKQY